MVGHLETEEGITLTENNVSRAQVLFCSMVSGFDNIHIRANLPRLEQAVKYGNSSGDRWGMLLSIYYFALTLIS